MAWFPNELDTTSGWKIPLLGIIPWLGKEPVALHLDAMASSPLSLLPRLVPAPHLLSEPTKCGPGRRKLPPPLQAHVGFGCCRTSHEPRSTVYMISKEMTSADCYTPLSISFWKCRYNFSEVGSSRRKANHTDRVPPLNPFAAAATKFREALKLISASEVIILGSFLATVGLVILSILQKDGPALLALVLISLHCVRCSYTLKLGVRTTLNKMPGKTHEVIVRTPENAFWVLDCDELSLQAVLDGNFGPFGRRELRSYEGFASLTDILRIPCVGLVFFLFSISKFVDQAAIAATYIFLTAVFWLVQPPGVGPREVTISPLYHPHALTSHLSNHDLRATEVQPSLARTIWYLLRITRSEDWVRSIQVIPEEPGWTAWLREAVENLSVDDWPAEAEKRRLVDVDERVYEEPGDGPEDMEESGDEIRPVDVSQW